MMKIRYILMAAVILFCGCSKSGQKELSAEEKVFARKWNQWIDDHSEEMNDLRSRAIADDMSDEDVAKEMISFMVRFSDEEDIDIPQRFIDDLKKDAGIKE